MQEPEPQLAKIDHEVQTSLEHLEEDSKRQAEEELKILREEKAVLEGKIRGYLALSDICHEYKAEISTLKTEYQKLLDKINTENSEMKAKSQPLNSESPTPDADPGNVHGHETDQPNPKVTLDPNAAYASSSPDHDKRQDTSPEQKTELYDTAIDPPKSSERVKSIPHSSNNHGNISEFIHVSDEKFPMQESIVVENLDHTSLILDPNTSLHGHASSDNMVLGQSAGSSQKRAIHLSNFSFPADSASKEGHTEADLENILRSITLESSENNRDGHRIAGIVSDYVKQNNKEVSKLKKLNQFLIDKNSESEKARKTLEKDNLALRTRIQDLEHRLYELSLSRSKSPQDTGWVHVENTAKNALQKSSPSTPSNQEEVEIQHLQTMNKQLIEANQRWSSEWEHLEKALKGRLAELQAERDRLAREMTEMKIADDAKLRDFERMLTAAKRKAGDEENAKEDALTQLSSANNHIEALQTQVTELKETVSTLRRNPQVIQSEVAQSYQMGTARTTNGKSVSELQTEVDVLRQQLLVFEEDFDRERQDRAMAQSVKDDYKKQNESLKKRVRQIEQKNTMLEKQLKVAEDTTRNTLSQNEKLQQDLVDARNQLQRERENQQVYFPQYNGPYQPPVMQSAGIQPPARTFMGQTVNPAAQHYIPQTQFQHHAPQYGGNQMVFRTPASRAGGPPAGYFATAARADPRADRNLELIPGAWHCNQCTYTNYPGRTVCEMCGYIQSPSQAMRFNGSNGPLRPRGDETPQFSPYMRAPSQNDITTDAVNTGM